MNHAQLLRRLLSEAAAIWQIELDVLYRRPSGTTREALVAVAVLAYDAAATASQINEALGRRTKSDFLFPKEVQRRHQSALQKPGYAERFGSLQRHYRLLIE